MRLRQSLASLSYSVAILFDAHGIADRVNECVLGGVTGDIIHGKAQQVIVVDEFSFCRYTKNKQMPLSNTQAITHRNSQHCQRRPNLECWGYRRKAVGKQSAYGTIIK